jgi:hypothetical protein
MYGVIAVLTECVIGEADNMTDSNGTLFCTECRMVKLSETGGGKALSSRHFVLGSSYVRMSSCSSTTASYKSVCILPVKCSLSKYTIFLSCSDI